MVGKTKGMEVQRRRPVSRTFAAPFRSRQPYGYARGDHALWGRIKLASKGEPWPSSVAEVRTRIADYFENIIGQPLAGSEMILAPQLGTYGISGGEVHPDYWLNTAIPHLERRYLALMDRH